MEEEQKSTRGGKREGAGRKPVKEKKQRNPTMSIMGTESELNRIREKAFESNMTASRFVIESLNCADSQN